MVKIMGLSWRGKSKSSGMSFLTGFKQVRALTNAAGSEKFGVIEVAPEYAADVFAPPAGNRKRLVQERVFTAALRLSGPGLNRWLAEPKDDVAFFTKLCQALPTDSPAQFLLRRRSDQMGEHYAAWQQHILNRMPDEEVAHFFLQDYLDSLIYPVEDGGLAQVWCGLLVSGRSEAELTDHLAHLVVSLPCDATPCSAEELSTLLIDYFAPTLRESYHEEDETDPDTLYSDWLTEQPLEISEDKVYNGKNCAYWTLSAPPLRHEAGWTRRLLENEVLTSSEFDITVHLAPAHQEETMREVLERRLASLEYQIEDASSKGQLAQVAELREQQQEIQNRLNALLNQRDRYFEANITLALRAQPEAFEDECIIFEEELVQCGLAAHRTPTSNQTHSAMLDCAPLNVSRFDRPFVLPAVEAGRLVHLGGVGQPENAPGQPLVGLSPAGEVVYFNPAQRVGQTAFFLLGEAGRTSTQEAGYVARYLTAMRWLRGGAVCGLDRKGEWARLVQQLGGRYVAFGAPDAEFNFNPLEVTGESLNQPDSMESWLRETGGFLSSLLELDEERREDLGAVLLEAAMGRLNRGEELSAASLWIQAESSGYTELVVHLKQLSQNGRWGWLCSRPTRLPRPTVQHDLLFLGLSSELRTAWNEETQRYYFARLFARFAAQLGTQPPTRPYLLLVDNAQELLTNPVASRSLGWVGQNSGRLGASVWLLSPRADEWLNSYTGRILLERAQTQVFFNQNGAGLTGAARRFNLSQRFVKFVREALPGAAAVRQLDEDGEAILFAFDPLPGDYIQRLASAPAQLGAPITQPFTPKPKPVEVQLFAPEEIWDDSELEGFEEATETPEDFDEPEWEIRNGLDPVQTAIYA